jgi:2-oxoglutarate/2-oxoacid ferredoxin oxidoreductase subunit beta
MANALGLEVKNYGGSPSTLCTGCGHDSISNHIIQACFQSDIAPWQIAKMSGIGCSSKIPAYFMSQSFAFNSMHGRMAPISTGAKVVQPNLYFLGVSGDGDTANIGLGGFVHLLRRNLPMVYIVANNGVFGLTKGQFSATADRGAKLKTGDTNIFENVDLCSIALDSGCTFVARSFSGDAKQMVPLLKAALRHNGTAFIDVISPCITFNNHDGSTKSYTYVKEHDIALQELGFVAPGEEPKVEYSEGESTQVELVDGSHLYLKKLDSRNHDVRNREGAHQVLAESRQKGELLTGLFFVDEKQETLVDKLNMPKKGIANLTNEELSVRQDQFLGVLKSFK